jgi:4,5-dihydroxyphthalate decarboxylase
MALLLHMPSNETPEIVIHGGDYEHTLGMPGAYAGVSVGYEIRRTREIFEEMLEHRRFEVCEFSLANYLTLRGTGQDWLTAVPVFPYRAFRQSLAAVRRDSPLVDLAQLAGTRIGVEDYSMTAAVWFRGVLRDECGVDHRSVTWVTRAKQRFSFPSGARVETAAQDLETLLLDGDIDAFLGMSLRDSALPPTERRLRPLLPDAQAQEEAYFMRTGIYPIHHCVVIRNDVLERAPRAADAVYAAYSAAKERAYRRQLGTTLLPWAKAYWTRNFERFGGDPLPYGLTATNRLTIGRLAGYLHEQGFIGAEPVIDTLFTRPQVPSPSTGEG